jgi:glycosyltransferase involved in cell wall biosynthesis
MSTTKPRVSVGLPVYNAEKYLEKAIDSILAQTYTDFELIISDNASVDRTQEICRSYAAQDPRVHYHRNDKNLGAVPNFNRVLALSSSEYHKWAPYDDLIAPDFLARCVEVLDRNPDVVLCYSRAKVIDEHGAYEVDYDPGPDTTSPKPHERFRNLILHPEYAIQQMGLIRTEILKKIGGHQSYPSSDEILLAELALCGQFYEIPERLYLYRRHSQQSTTTTHIQRARVLFFDTSFAGKIVLPKWLYFFGCLNAIRRAPISSAERANCYMHTIRWLFVPANFRAMGKDMLIAANQMIARTFFKQSRPEVQQTMRSNTIVH